MANTSQDLMSGIEQALEDKHRAAFEEMIHRPAQLQAFLALLLLPWVM